MYPRLGKTSYFSHNGFLALSGNTPPQEEITRKGQQGTEPAASVVVPTWNPLTAFQLAGSECGGFFFFNLSSVCKCSFCLTPGISFCADTYPRSNLYETILLRQAFCALLNDGCLREMVIMIDFEP